MWLQSSGIVKTGSSLGKFHGANPYWLILQCDKGIADFYTHQIKVEYPDRILDHPLAGSHISIVRDEKPRRDPWRALVGSRIQFEYEPIVNTNGKHWWLKVRSEALSEARLSMGLLARPSVPFHLTVAVEPDSTPEQVSKMNPTVAKRISILCKMRSQIDPEIWTRLSESEELNTLERRFQERE